MFYNSRYEPAMCDADARVASGLSAAGISVHPSAGLLLQEPWDVKVGGVQGTCMPCMQMMHMQAMHASGSTQQERCDSHGGSTKHPQVQGCRQTG